MKELHGTGGFMLAADKQSVVESHVWLSFLVMTESNVIL